MSDHSMANEKLPSNYSDDHYDDEPDEDDPNKCPDCGGDLYWDEKAKFSWCPDVGCMWIEPEDPELDAIAEEIASEFASEFAS